MYNKTKKKITCECGDILTKIHYQRHLKSLKHQSNLNDKLTEPQKEKSEFGKRFKKITCECGVIFTNNHYSSHIQSSRHTYFITHKNDNDFEKNYKRIKQQNEWFQYCLEKEEEEEKEKEVIV